MSDDILAFLDRAITATERAAQDACEGGAGRWQSGWCPEEELEEGETPGSGVVDERDKTVVYDEGYPTKPQSVHIALHDPESVLRRCAADRRMLNLHGGRHHSCPTLDDDGDPDFTEFYDHEACPVIQLLAKGYGWTEGER